MKSPTVHYKKLKKALDSLKIVLTRVPDHVCDTKLQNLKVQSFIFLAHAAFEEYLEELSKSASDEALRLLNQNGMITRSLVSLIACETIAQIDSSVPRKKIKLDVATNFQTFANAAKVNHHQAIMDNNGVRLANLKTLFVPIGIEPQDCDLGTSNALDGLGLKRGGIAHSFVMKRAETKSSILGDVKTIFDGLLIFDRKACENLAERMTRYPII